MPIHCCIGALGEMAIPGQKKIAPLFKTAQFRTDACTGPRQSNTVRTASVGATVRSRKQAYYCTYVSRYVTEAGPRGESRATKMLSLSSVLWGGGRKKGGEGGKPLVHRRQPPSSPSKEPDAGAETTWTRSEKWRKQQHWCWLSSYWTLAKPGAAAAEGEEDEEEGEGGVGEEVSSSSGAEVVGEGEEGWT